jgi:hypothetical protein
MGVSNLAWRKSSYSEPNGGNCIQLADLGDRVAVRDSKDPAGGMIVLSKADLAAFLAEVKSL